MAVRIGGCSVCVPARRGRVANYAGGQGERAGVQAERQRDGDGEQETAQGRADEHLTDRGDGVLIAVRLVQQGFRDHVRQDRLRRVTEDHLARAEPERHHDQDGNAHFTDGRQERHDADDGRLDRL